MILTCPACATSYFVPDAVIGPSGRRVRCKACGQDWRAMPEDAPLELNEGVAVAASPSFGASTPLQEEPAEEAAAPPLTQAFRARAEQKRRQQDAIRQGLSWGLLSVMILLVLGAAYFWRDSIVAKVPKLASAYSLFGIQTNPIGLDFEGVNAGFARNDIGQIYISGAVRNLRDREIVTPPIRITLLDRNKVAYHQHILRLDKPPVLPGGVQGFAVILPNTDGRFAETTVSFAPELTARASGPAPAPEPKVTPPAAPPAEVVPDAQPAAEAKSAAAAAPAQTAPRAAQPAPKSSRPRPVEQPPKAVAPTDAPTPYEAVATPPQAMSAMNNDGLRRIDDLSFSAKSN